MHCYRPRNNWGGGGRWGTRGFLLWELLTIPTYKPISYKLIQLCFSPVCHRIQSVECHVVPTRKLLSRGRILWSLSVGVPTETRIIHRNATRRVGLMRVKMQNQRRCVWKLICLLLNNCFLKVKFSRLFWYNYLVRLKDVISFDCSWWKRSASRLRHTCLNLQVSTYYQNQMDLIPWTVFELNI